MTKSNRPIALLVCFAMIFSLLLPLAWPASAADVNAPREVIVPEGTSMFVVHLFVEDLAPCAGIEFGFTISDESAVKFGSLALDSALSGASAIPLVTTRNTYYFGFYATTNRYSGNLKVATLQFTYSGNAEQTITITQMMVARIGTNGKPVGTANLSPVATIKVKRGTSGTGDNNDPPEVNIVVIEEDGVALSGGIQSKYFDDVGMNVSWAVDAIDWLYERGVVQGIGNRLYAPTQNLTRGDLILLLVRAFDLKAEIDGNFPDVPVGSYYYDAIAVAKVLDIARGDGVNFHPGDWVTRQDVMALVDRTLTSLGKGVERGSAADLAPFADAGMIAGYAVESVASLVKAGIIKGTGAGINPGGFMTRAEIATVLYRILEAWD